jgi:hypothetical protein
MVVFEANRITRQLKLGHHPISFNIEGNEAFERFASHGNRAACVPGLTLLPVIDVELKDFPV